MEIHFYKYQGTGNDFIILDNRNQIYNDLNRKSVAFLCNRRFGIGADGLMLLNSHSEYDFEMKYFNSDGGESSMCGNGGRCLVKFAFDIGIIKDKYRFLAIDGVHEAFFDQEGRVSLKMNDVDAVYREKDDFILNTGSPHYVKFIDAIKDFDVYNKGKEIRYSEAFTQEGINVNFIERTSEINHIKVRTYERGVEDETFSCGTGVTACAIVASLGHPGNNQVAVETLGGELIVKFENHNENYVNVWLIGAATKVFEGDIKLNS